MRPKFERLHIAKTMKEILLYPKTYMQITKNHIKISQQIHASQLADRR